ncbi:hypothetical protein D3C72_1598790 [compost metagenome]
MARPIGKGFGAAARRAGSISTQVVEQVASVGPYELMMRTCGKRCQSSSAMAGVSDSAPKTKTRRSGRWAWSKAGLNSCCRTNEGVEAHTLMRVSARYETKASRCAMVSRGHSTQVPPSSSAPTQLNSEKSKLNSIWSMNTGAAPRSRQSRIQPAKRATLSRPICTPLGSPVLPDVNMM